MLNQLKNFRTGEHEAAADITDYSDYIPQDSVSQGLYRRFISQGDKPIVAACKALVEVVLARQSAIAGVKENTSC
ncbi:hypothetical protein [Chlorobium sp.]|uniref:hypothetical protein n=1 Tax=Chlorobium sp. TaxID=1095 RepID=UPI003C3A5A8D